MRKSVIFLWLGLAILVGFFWVYFPALSHYRDLKLDEERISKELTDLDSKIQVLQEERDLLKNDVAYLEKVIREELGLVKPGEIVYKFVPEEAKKTEPSPPVPVSSRQPGSLESSAKDLSSAVEPTSGLETH